MQKSDFHSNERINLVELDSEWISFCLRFLFNPLLIPNFQIMFQKLHAFLMDETVMDSTTDSG